MNFIEKKYQAFQCVCMCVCVCVGGGGVIPWMFEPEIFNLSPRGITLQVTSTVAYSVKEAGQM